MAGGFLSELGPYYPTAGGKLQENPHAWTQVSLAHKLDLPAAQWQLIAWQKISQVA